MLALLRSAHFRFKDDAAGIVIELRRHHDESARAKNKEFLVTRRLTRTPTLITKAYGTYREAADRWDLEVKILTDKGLERRDIKIVGFHEEG